jgi:hypothetical protein
MTTKILPALGRALRLCLATMTFISPTVEGRTIDQAAADAGMIRLSGEAELNLAKKLSNKEFCLYLSLM